MSHTSMLFPTEDNEHQSLTVNSVFRLKVAFYFQHNLLVLCRTFEKLIGLFKT